MTLSGARALCGLTAQATPAGSGVTGRATLGHELWEADLPAGLDVMHSFRVTATGAGDVAVVALDTGVVTATNGSPTITDGDGNDFEGADLADMATLYGVLYEVVEGSDGYVSLGGMGTLPALTMGDGTSGQEQARCLLVSEAGVDVQLSTQTITLSAVGGDVRVTLLGSSS